MNKKGQDLSLSTIIVAALGLLVLVVLAAIMTGRLGQFGIQLGQTQEAGACDAQCKSYYPPETPGQPSKAVGRIITGTGTDAATMRKSAADQCTDGIVLSGVNVANGVCCCKQA